MKWNISLGAALSLTLAACGGGRSYADYGPETAASQSSPAALALGGAGEYRSPEPAQLDPAYQDNGQPGGQPGAAYAAPGEPQRVYRPPTPVAQDQADPAAGAIGPSGSSRQAQSRYDEVGYAGIRPAAPGADSAVVAVHRSLPPGSFAEVTSLDTGRTILVLITGALSPDSDHPIDLSAGAARQLGYDSQQTAAVRIRRVNPTPSDQAALNQGQPATRRPDAPPVLLTALRKHLPAAAVAAAPAYSRPAAPPRTPPATRAPSGRGYFVQVAALSNARNAQSLAQSMAGFVKPGGGLYRVQIGPFATRGQADAARKRAADAGYGDARVFAN